MHQIYNTQKVARLQQEAQQKQQQGGGGSDNNSNGSSIGTTTTTSSSIPIGGGFKSTYTGGSGGGFGHPSHPLLSSSLNTSGLNNSRDLNHHSTSRDVGYGGGGIVGDDHTLIYNNNHNNNIMSMTTRNKPSKFMLTYSVGAVGGQRHCFGVNSLALGLLGSDTTNGLGEDSLTDQINNSSSSLNHTLFTAGRDSTIKAWSVDSLSKDATHQRCFEDHTDWINDIFLSKDGQLLVSGSSDSSIKIWNSKTGECLKTLKKPHDDYVKALAYSPAMNVFASTGLDSQIILWDLNECTAIQSMHLPPIEEIDIKLNSSTNSLGGGQPIINNNNSEIFDDTINNTPTNKSTLLNSSGIISSISKPSPLYKSNRQIVGRAGGDGVSIYSLAMNDQATLVLAGSTGRTIHGWDIRGGQVALKLKGHTENVRSLVMSRDGKLCVSASSDGSFRLWDVGTRKCVHTFDDVHQDSVWKVVTDQSFSRILSGGRDGLVYSTDLRTLQSTLVVREKNPILGLLLEEEDNRVWVSTIDSTVKNWSIADTNTNPRKSNEFIINSLSREPRFVDEVDNEPITTNNPFITNSNHTNVIIPSTSVDDKQPNIIIEGRPGIIQHHVMNNRRHLLTKDTDDNVELWDVARGEIVQSFGHGINFDKKVEELQEVISIPKWMSIDTKTGGINVTLELSQCFKADTHLSNLGVTVQEGEDDLPYNIGERVLASLFSYWKQSNYHHPQNVNNNYNNYNNQNNINNNVNNNEEKDDTSTSSLGTVQATPSTNNNPLESPHHSLINQQPTINNGSNNSNNCHDDDNESNNSSHDSFTRKKPIHLSGYSTNGKSSTSNVSSSTTTPNSLTPNTSTNSMDGLLLCKEKKMIFELPRHTSVVIWDETSGTTIHRGRIDEFTPESSGVIPQWVLESVLNSKYPSNRETGRLTFSLTPMEEGKNISPVPKGSRFQAGGSTQMRKISAQITQFLGLLEPSSNCSAPPEEFVEIFCNGKLLPVRCSLLTVKTFFWKSSDDIHLQYRVKSIYGSETELRKLIKSNQLNLKRSGSTPNQQPLRVGNNNSSNYSPSISNNNRNVIPNISIPPALSIGQSSSNSPKTPTT